MQTLILTVGHVPALSWIIALRAQCLSDWMLKGRKSRGYRRL
ncbi:hypothetical protein [uncultured Algimonas sp.]|nr:hypothetical protein [uncultured Algimonas sp.]